MFTRFFGYLWVFIGILWIVKPGILKGWFTRKANWKLIWLVWGLIFFMAFHLGTLAFKIKFTLLRDLAIAGIFLIAVMIWIFQGKARSKVTAWCQKIPLLYFQIAGGFNVALGISLIISAGKK